MKIGVLLPTSGSVPSSVEIAKMAQTIEDCGYASAWVVDHIAMPRSVASRYPFSDDGLVGWDASHQFFDAVTSLAVAASATSRIEIGTAVLVLPLRHPAVVAKQIASIGVGREERIALGVGAGWLEEEFGIMGVDFSERGPILTEAIQVVRDCWQGISSGIAGDHFFIPEGSHFFPRPGRDIPILVGGNSRAALHRVARHGDGWIGLERFERFDLESVHRRIRTIRALSSDHGRDSASLRLVLRVINGQGKALEIRDWIDDLEEIGITDLILDIDWGVEDPCTILSVLS